MKINQLTLAIAAVASLSPLCHDARAAGGVPVWTNFYNGPANSYDVARAIAVDSSGNVFVTGSSAVGSASTLRTGCGTIKYSNDGVPLWTNRFDRPGNLISEGRAVAVDSSGNVFVAGTSARSSDGIYVYTTIAYSSSGASLWTNFYPGPGLSHSYANAVAVDSNGTVFVTGISFGTKNYDDYATVAYSSAGVPLWTNRYNGATNGQASAVALAVDRSGHVFVTGNTLDPNGYGDYATLAYSASGLPLWTNRYNGNFGDGATAIAVDNSGHVFVTGFSVSVSDGNYAANYATVAYSSEGLPLWTNFYDGLGSGGSTASAVAADNNGHVLVTGTSASNDGNVAFATVAYSAAGAPLWTNRYNSPGSIGDSPTALAVDSNGNVFVTGSSFIGTDTYYATVAYSGAGLPLWTNLYNSPGNANDAPTAIAVDRSGNVFVTGSSGAGSASDYATIKYSAYSSVPTAVIRVSPLASFPGISNLIVIAANNVTACLKLDGSASSDPENDPLTYQWFNGSDSLPFATGVVVTNCLGLGAHTIRLVVSDPHGTSGSAEITVNIISPCAGVGIAEAEIERSSLPQNRKHPLLVSLHAACDSFKRGGDNSGVNQLNAFERKVRAQVQKSDPVLAQQLIDIAEVIIGAMDDK